MGVTMEVPSFIHGDVNEGPVNPGKIDASHLERFLPREACLGFFQSMWKDRPKGGRPARVAVRKGLSDYNESRFLRFANVDTQAIGIGVPVRGKKS